MQPKSDWKTFRELVPSWRERFLLRQNQELIAILSREDKTPTENFWEAEERIEDLAKILHFCLDRHSRSRLSMSLASMYSYGMIQDQDLECFSEPLRNKIME
jgi:hypothetical protein